ncbi:MULTISPECIES: hypothetical protein [unclassified Meridianimarinicoccus]|uniref:hypothetical protein n=1 Tax=unclassified Meridianimarinicoccus TaxID=2923344 RepID=UPI001865C43F|nr:hypothetical protein [Fluviibacterium sp. MJW13]
MRNLALAAVALGLAACAPSANDNLATMVGAGNAAAIEAASACNFDTALTQAQREATSPRGETQLFSQFTQAAIYTETGQSAKAAAAVDMATNSATMNPDGASRDQMQQGANGVLKMVRDRRYEITGSPDC